MTNAQNIFPKVNCIDENKLENFQNTFPRVKTIVEKNADISKKSKIWQNARVPACPVLLAFRPGRGPGLPESRSHELYTKIFYVLNSQYSVPGV